jgi:hypothetical protein
LHEFCLEFIHLVSSEATEICEKEQKKTINGDHVIQALTALGLDQYTAPVSAVQEEFLKSCKENPKKSFKLEDLGMSHEELLKSQEELFMRARMNMQQQQQQQQDPKSP